ncbi:MAG: protein SypD [Moraxellaceae bacterium]|nr:MAG: protein SypD [Moraxellaceae bacterium]
MNIPPQNMEIESIYAQILNGSYRSIALTSSSANEGVTSIAFALAQRNLLAGHSTLFVDLNLHHPSLSCQLKLGQSKSDISGMAYESLLPSPEIVSPKVVSHGNADTVITGVTNPNSRDAIIKLRKPGVLEECIKEWQMHFDTIIIDTSPVNRVNASNIPAERVASACDGCILVVLANQTTEPMISETAKKLLTANAKLLGCVINDRENPPLHKELIREIDRLPRFLDKHAIKLRRWVNNNLLLALNI